MFKDYDEKIKTEVIVLSDLKNLDYKNYLSYYEIWRLEYEKEKEYPNKSKEEIKAEIKEEIKKEKEKYAKETKEKFYQINNDNTKELDEKFKQVKLKVNFNCEQKILNDEKFYTISQGCFTVYDNRFFNKLFEIKFKGNYIITSVIQLDNKDLVFFAINLLIIYRLKEGKYVLFQKIEENQTGFHIQISYSGCCGYPKTYKAKYIKEISGNRFICVSNFGFKIYSLNEKNEYSLALLEWYHEGLKTILELDKNSFLFCSQIYCEGSIRVSTHNDFIIDKIDLRKITQTEKENKLYYQSDVIRYYYGRREKNSPKNTNEKAIKTIDSLKITYDHKQFMKYITYEKHHYFQGNAILKNKYLVIGIGNYILIYDIFSGEELKRYELLINGKDSLYICNANIKKWKNDEDNEFLINIKGNIVLFKLTNDNDLKIINQSYYENINYLKKLNEKNNVFYDDGKKDDTYYDRDYYSYSNDNKNYCVTIFH